MQEALVLLISAIVVVVVLHRLRASPVLGYLVALAAVGVYAVDKPRNKPRNFRKSLA